MVALASTQPDLTQDLLVTEREEHELYVESIITDLTLGKITEAEAVAQLKEATDVVLPSGVYPRLAMKIIGHLCDAVSWGKHVDDGNYERRKLPQQTALSFFASAATTLSLNTRETYLYVAQNQVRDMQPYLKALSETLGADAQAIRLAGFNEMAKPRGPKGRHSLSVSALVGYITDVLDATVAGGAKAQVYNRIAMKALKWGVWHYRGNPAEQTADLVKATKALFGEERSGQRIKLITDYINTHLASLKDRDHGNTASAYRRGISFLIGIKDMPMSQKARGMVFENILQLAKDSTRATELYRDRDEASVEELVLQAAEAYVPELDDKAHPGLLAQAQTMRDKAFEAYAFVTEASVSRSKDAYDSNAVQSFTALIETGRKLGNADRAYEMGLAILDRAVEAGTVSKRNATEALNTFDIRHYASPKYKLEILDRVAAYILTDTSKGDSRSRESYMVLGHAIDNTNRADVAKTFSKHACRIRSAAQMQQMKMVAEALDYGHAGKDVDTTEAVEQNIALGRVGKQLAIVFTTALDDGGIERFVAIGRNIKTVSDHVREIEAHGAANAQVDEAAARVRELRALVRKAALANDGLNLKAA
ncbi:MAG: hypothetical protein EBQ96_04030 [Proteobacteria bacterium]|nr:hypothetical protein [Pseudomonadota bacterium]